MKDVLDYFHGLQDRITAAFEKADKPFQRDAWQRPNEPGKLRGYGEVRMLEGGDVFERAGIALSNVQGDSLPKPATEKHAHITGKPFTAMGVSLVVHPKNPYIPTVHMNVRYFATTSGKDDVWWFGGGFDLTPYYPFLEDVRAWHTTAKAACDPFGADVYPRLKAACDSYFFLKHRNETRGVGGLFADDLSGDREQCFGLTRSIGDHFIPAYMPIVEKRRAMPFGAREREWQAYRRGRYVEFNLVFDRGTSFGLQTGGRTEAILLSMPPNAAWRYAHTPEPGSAEYALLAYLSPRDYLAIE